MPMSCGLPVAKMARAFKVFLLAKALVVSSGLQLVHFEGESAGQRQQVSARGFDEQVSKSRTFPTAKSKSPGVLSAPLSVSSSFRGTHTSRLARALSLRPVGWEEGPGKSSAAVAMQGGEASALLEVNATPTTTTTYESLGHGICACRNPTRKNGLELDLCNSDVYVQGWVPAPAPEEFSCRRLCSDAADCMAYQEYSETERSQYRDSFQYEKTNSTQQGEGVLRRWCLLWQWHRVPIGVFRWEDIFGRSDFSESLKRGLDLWKSVPCMRKVVQLTDGRSRFQLESVEKFAIMPRERDVREGNGHGLDRFCTCRATTPTGGDDTEEKETVCRVADERVNMSQEAAESLCLERNRHVDEGSSSSLSMVLKGSINKKDRDPARPSGCAGFMSFTPLFSAHPKAGSVLFFSGGQTVTGIAADREEYEEKGGPKTGPASSYLRPDGWPLYNRIPQDIVFNPVGKFEAERFQANLPRCVYYVGDKLHDRLVETERLSVLFNVAVGGVAVFSVALLVVVAFLVIACRKRQKMKSRPVRGGTATDVGKDSDRKAKDDPLPRDQTRSRDGPVAARVQEHDEKGPQPPTPAKKKARQVRGVAEDLDRGFLTRYADYRLDVRDRQPVPLQGRHLRAGVGQGEKPRKNDFDFGQGAEGGGEARGEADHHAQGAPLALGNNDPVAFPEPLTQTWQVIMGLQMETQEEDLGELPPPVNPRAHSTGKGGREGTATSGTHQVEHATRAASATPVSASLSLFATNGDGASADTGVHLVPPPPNSSVTGPQSRPTSETPPEALLVVEALPPLVAGEHGREKLPGLAVGVDPRYLSTSTRENSRSKLPRAVRIRK
eukprot:CAMPEP_0178993336 /NCGR_PEP_ID=MMETSP0795-20121207/6647_1 /TAXON_ID=88552 /ORGANISM="Amoebophrya sp., Strain Ameob2" /LENGTH=836 /DNA_ID=CAMNT_0020685385 /DNA_START=184 /DNA_END=2695 /DNA_ORIENTATION=-